MLPPSNNFGTAPAPAPAVAPAFARAPDVSLPSTSVAATSLPSLHRPPFQVGVDQSDSDLSPIPNQAEAAAETGVGDTVITVTMTPSITTTATSPPTAHPGSPTDDGPINECRLLGSFAILVQLALGGLALLALVYKRWRERPQRPVKIWFFDASKQVFGSVLVHGANVFMSLLTSGKYAIAMDPVTVAGQMMVRRAVGGLLMGRDGQGGGEEEYVPNPCSFYLLNLGIDTTLGIPILIVIVRVLTRLVAMTPLGQPPESIQSGNYGSPPNAWWWFKQSIIYFCGLMGMKLCVLILFMVLPWLPHIGDWALGWTEGNEKLQIVFVMMLFPLCMNAMQYYIIDSYIKKQEALDGEGSAAVGENVAYDELAISDTDESDDDANEDARKNSSRRGSHLRMAATKDASSERSSRDLEYDPDVDGDSQTVIGSSSSRLSGRGVLPKELLPHE